MKNKTQTEGKTSTECVGVTETHKKIKGCQASCRISPLTQEMLTCGVSTIDGCVWLCDDCIDSLAQEEDERVKQEETKLTKEDLETIFILMYPSSKKVMQMDKSQKVLRKLRIMLKEASK